jgi:hypothetical protein
MTKQQFIRYGWEVLQPLPYSPDLVLSHSVFWACQKVFALEVINWLHALDADIFAKGCDALVSYWDTCLNRDSDYLQKFCLFVCVRACVRVCVRVRANVRVCVGGAYMSLSPLIFLDWIIRFIFG